MRTLEFRKQTRLYPGFNFDKPTIVYQLHNQNNENVKVEFIFNINAKIIINNKIYYVSPPPKKKLLGEINILNENKELIGIIDYFGWTMKTKKVTLFKHNNNLNEEWIIDDNMNIFKKKYWNNETSDIEIENNGKIFKLKKEKKIYKSKNILGDNMKSTINITVTEPFNETYFMSGIIIYLLELKEFLIN